MGARETRGEARETRPRACARARPRGPLGIDPLSWTPDDWRCSSPGAFMRNAPSSSLVLARVALSPRVAGSLVGRMSALGQWCASKRNRKVPICRRVARCASEEWMHWEYRHATRQRQPAQRRCGPLAARAPDPCSGPLPLEHLPTGRRVRVRRDESASPAMPTPGRSEDVHPVRSARRRDQPSRPPDSRVVGTGSPQPRPCRRAILRDACRQSEPRLGTRSQLTFVG
jgi:hypothetical protein